MRSSKVVYLVTRAHGLRRHLLRTEDYIRLLKVESVLGIVDFLSHGDYSSDLSRLPPKEVDAYLLEKIVDRRLSDRFSSLLEIASGKIGDALKQYYRKLEVENLKRVVRAEHENVQLNENQLIPIARKYQTVNFPAILEARNISEMVYLLSETPYDVLKEKVDLYTRYNNPLILEASIESVYYKNLWKKIGDLPEKDEIEQLVGTEMDLRNLSLVFSSKQKNMDRDLLDEMILGAHYRLQKGAIDAMSDAPYAAIPELLAMQAYVDLARDAVDLFQEGKFTEIENSFSRYVYSNAERAMTRRPNSSVFVFAYLGLCFREAKNLTTLAIGKEMRLSDEEIRKLMFI